MTPSRTYHRFQARVWRFRVLNGRLKRQGRKRLAHALPYVDYAAFGLDIGMDVWEYNEFKKKLKDAQQRGCKCVQDATNH